MTTAKGPVTIRENSTAGTPTSTVSGSASPRASPTGMKSQPTCGLIANSAGSEYCGGMSPWPISTPMSVPTIWAITAPGPSSGDSTGSEQMMEMASSPTRLEASGVRRSAIHVPIPVARMTPMISEMNAMKGRTLRITMSIDSRPAWYSAPTAVRSTISRGMIPTTRPTKVSPPWRNTSMKFSAHWPRVSLMPATGGAPGNRERSATASNSFPDTGMDGRRGGVGRDQDPRGEARDRRPGRQLGRGQPDQGRHRPGVGEHGDPAQRLGRGDAVVGPHRHRHVRASPHLAGRGADRHPPLPSQGPGPPHEALCLLVGEHQLEQPEHAEQDEGRADAHARSFVMAFTAHQIGLMLVRGAEGRPIQKAAGPIQERERRPSGPGP